MHSARVHCPRPRPQPQSQPSRHWGPAGSAWTRTSQRVGRGGAYQRAPNSCRRLHVPTDVFGARGGRNSRRRRRRCRRRRRHYLRRRPRPRGRAGRTGLGQCSASAPRPTCCPRSATRHATRRAICPAAARATCGSRRTTTGKFKTARKNQVQSNQTDPVHMHCAPTARTLTHDTLPAAGRLRLSIRTAGAAPYSHPPGPAAAAADARAVRRPPPDAAAAASGPNSSASDAASMAISPYTSPSELEDAPSRAPAQ